MTQWTITEDLICDPGASAVGTVGPRGATMTAAEIRGHPEAVEFQLLDDDDNVYFRGFMTGDDDFAPLDDFGESYGCTALHYRSGGLWVPL